MRWLFRIAGVVVAAVVVSVIGLLLLPNERIVQIASDQIEAQTGRALAVSGDVSLSVWPVLGVRTGPVTLGNADWAGPEPMLTASGLSIGVSAADLIGGSIRVTGIIVQDPVLRLQSHKDGRANWELEQSPASADQAAPSNGTAASDSASPSTTPDAVADRPVSLDLLELRNGTVIYQDGASEPITLRAFDLDVRWPDPTGPAKIAATLRQMDEPVEITGELANPTAFMEGAVSQISAQAKLPKGNAAFAGRANMTGELAGRFEAASANLSKTMRSLGLEAVSLPAGWGPAVRVASDVTYTADGRLSLRDMSCVLGDNRLNGVADITLSDVPMITAKLAAGVLTFPDASGGAPTGGASSGAAPAASSAPPGVTDEGWSRDKIDASALGLVNGSIRLTAEGIRTPDLTVGSVRLRLEIERSRAVLHLEDVSVFNGRVTGRLVGNNRSGFSVGGKLAAKDIDILALQRDLLGMERIRGKAAGELEFLGVGSSVDTIMRSLSGKGGMRMNQGVILGLDLDRLMRGDTASGGTTVFDSLSASFVMREGSLFNEDLLLQLSNYRADGKGRIGLGARDIDYTFTPVALRARSGQGISLPIRIKGPWGAPRIWPDLEAAAKLNLDEERKALEDEAKAKLQQKLSEELEVQIEDGQDVEEVLKDKLEDEAKNQLLKLLGRD